MVDTEANCECQVLPVAVYHDTASAEALTARANYSAPGRVVSYSRL